MIIIHHNDNDGKCAAAIVKNELATNFACSTDIFISYNHSGKIDLPSDEIINEHNIIYIVDLSLDDVVLAAINKFISMGKRVVHIDHHTTTFKYIWRAECGSPLKELLDNTPLFTHFYKSSISGCMLTWIYTCMNEEEQKHPSDVSFEFTEKRTHVHIESENHDTEYRIPNAIRYIDDNDVWLNEIPDAKYFTSGFILVEKDDPSDNIWIKMLYDLRDETTSDIVSKGITLFKYQSQINESVLKNAFVASFNSCKVLCLNTQFGNSRVFGDKFDEYDAVCKFAYDGSTRLWKYHMYSSDKRETFLDVENLCRRFGGGGHVHAGGFSCKDNIFAGRKYRTTDGNKYGVAIRICNK